MRRSEPLAGGDTDSSFRITDGRLSYFVKLSLASDAPRQQAEIRGLTALSASPHIATPNIICRGIHQNHSFLVLEYLALTPGTEGDFAKLGKQLAKMHQSSCQTEYGWQYHNFIGKTPQCNSPQQNWCDFFAHQRIGYVLGLLAQQGINFGPIDTLVSQVKQRLSGHQPLAALLHGDLWSGNIGFCGATPVLFDPAVYFGDRETDLAMTELFGGFPAAFYEGYHRQWPLPEGYAQRKKLYQLYHLLNHVLLFGEQYLTTTRNQLQQLTQSLAHT